MGIDLQIFGIDLDKGKGIKYLTFMVNTIYYSIKLLNKIRYLTHNFSALPK